MTDRSPLPEPLFSLQLNEPLRGHFRPGDELVARYQLDAVDPADIQAIEASVLWYTEGKGDEDMAVHFFQRRLPVDAEGGDLRLWHEVRTPLPNSPLSYSGVIVKVRWCFRVRAFLRRGREVAAEKRFALGNLPTAIILETSQTPATISKGIERPRGEELD